MTPERAKVYAEHTVALHDSIPGPNDPHMTPEMIRDRMGMWSANTIRHWLADGVRSGVFERKLGAGFARNHQQRWYYRHAKPQGEI